MSREFDIVVFGATGFTGFAPSHGTKEGGYGSGGAWLPVEYMARNILMSMPHLLPTRFKTYHFQGSSARNIWMPTTTAGM